MLRQEDIEANCKLAIEYLSGEVDEVEINLESVAEEEIVVREQKTDKLVASNSRKITVIVYLNNCQGVSSTTASDFNSIKQACDKACEIARLTAADRHFGLVEKKFFYNEDTPKFKSYYKWCLSGREKLDLAMQAEKMMLVENKIKFCESVEICSWQSYVWQFNTKGLDARFLSSVYSMSAVCIANNKDRLVRDFDYTVARDANNLDSVDVLARNVVEKTLSRIGAKTLSTQKASVIFSSEMSRLLFGYLAKAISGDRVYKESSFLADFLYEKILPEFISIEQSPHLDSTIGSLAFDADGAATSNRLFVKSGVLNSFILGGLSSRRLGFDTTANAGGIQTWLVKDDRDISFKDILSSMGDGLYVTEMMGSGVDLTNGDFSQGVFGYWVENGVVSYPVHEITIAGNLKDMFNGCMGISNDVNKNGTIQVGSMLVDNMVIAGNS